MLVAIVRVTALFPFAEEKAVLEMTFVMSVVAGMVVLVEAVLVVVLVVVVVVVVVGRVENFHC